MRCFRRTLLPPPLRPIITSVSPFATVRSMPRKISWRPICFVRSRTAIIADLVAAAVLGGSGARSTAAITVPVSTLNLYNVSPSLHIVSHEFRHRVAPGPGRLSRRMLVFSIGQHAVDRPLRDEVFHIG